MAVYEFQIQSDDVIEPSRDKEGDKCPVNYFRGGKKFKV